MISVLLSARSSWAKLHPVVTALVRLPLECELVVCGAALLHRYGSVVTQAEDFLHDHPYCWRLVRFYSVYDGTTLETSAKETASLLSSLTDYYSTTRPALVMVCADRHETVAASMAAAYLNIPVAHLQGGERSGNIDDRVRDMNSVLATLHFPCTERAVVRLGLLTRPGSRVVRTGCPSIDVAREALQAEPLRMVEAFGGVGPPIDCRHPFLLQVLHPETERPREARAQMTMVLEATRAVPLPRIVLWPGQDAGAEHGAKVIREYVAQHPADTFHVLRGLPPQVFLRLVAQASVLVGNSSVGIREASYLGTPVVNVGDRQAGRERAANVIDVPFEDARVFYAIQTQVAHGRYSSSDLYGHGHAATAIAGEVKRWLA